MDVTSSAFVAWAFVTVILLSIVAISAYVTFHRGKKFLIFNTAVCVMYVVICIIFIALVMKISIPQIDDQNRKAVQSVTNCTVYNLTTYTNMTSLNIEYTVYFKHLPDPDVYLYSGVCERLVPCYPTINQTIDCYPNSFGYTVKPVYIETGIFIVIVILSSSLIFVNLVLYGLMVYFNYGWRYLKIYFGSGTDNTTHDNTTPLISETSTTKQLYQVTPIVASLDDRKIYVSDRPYSELNYGTLEGSASTVAPKCSACMENTPTIMFNQCHHLCMCTPCALKYISGYCPICREPGDKIRVYM